jgi:hypothetical protein
MVRIANDAPPSEGPLLEPTLARERRRMRRAERVTRMRGAVQHRDTVRAVARFVPAATWPPAGGPSFTHRTLTGASQWPSVAATTAAPDRECRGSVPPSPEGGPAAHELARGTRRWQKDPACAAPIPSRVQSFNGSSVLLRNVHLGALSSIPRALANPIRRGECNGTPRFRPTPSRRGTTSR